MNFIFKKTFKHKLYLFKIKGNEQQEAREKQRDRRNRWRDVVGVGKIGG